MIEGDLLECQGYETLLHSHEDKTAKACIRMTIRRDEDSISAGTQALPVHLRGQSADGLGIQRHTRV
jgi:hypothetical protein